MRSAADPRSRRGFTLLELLAALTLSAVAIGGAWRLLEQMGDSRDRVKLETIRITRAQNGVRLLRTLVLSAQAGLDTTEQFMGTDTAATFSSWCLGIGGSLRRCRVSLSVWADRDSSDLVAQITDASRSGIGDARTATTLVLLRRARPTALRYIETSPDSAIWVKTWQTSLTTPAGLAVVSGGSKPDTVVLPIGVAR